MKSLITRALSIPTTTATRAFPRRSKSGLTGLPEFLLGEHCGEVTVIDPATDTFTAAAHGLENNDLVRLTSLGTLPTGLTKGLLYHVVGATTDTFQVSESQGGSAVNITTDGEGRLVFEESANNQFGWLWHELELMRGCEVRIDPLDENYDEAEDVPQVLARFDGDLDSRYLSKYPSAAAAFVVDPTANGWRLLTPGTKLTLTDPEDVRRLRLCAVGSAVIVSIELHAEGARLGLLS